jgi:hypothetical protein
MKSLLARLSICVLFGVLILGVAFGQSQPSQRNSSSAASAANRKQANPQQARKSATRFSPMQSNPTTSIGLLSAIQIPAGSPGLNNCSGVPSCAQSQSPYPAVLGNFLGPNGGQQMATMVLAHHPQEYALMVMETANGAFTPKLTIPNTAFTEYDQVLAADVNGDGYTDLVVIQADGDYWVFLNDGSSNPGFFKAGTPTPITTGPLLGATLVAQPPVGNAPPTFNLIAIDEAIPNNVWTLVGTSSGTFGTPTSAAFTPQLSTSNTNTLVFGNFFNHTNGLTDFVGNAASNNAPNVFQNTGSGYSPTQLTTADGNYDSCFNTAGDLSGHATALDVLSANCFDNNITVFVNNGSGTFATGVYYDVFGAPGALTVADVNGDGNNDVLSVNNQSSDVATLLGSGNGTLQAQTAGFAVGGHAIVPAVPVANPSTPTETDLLVADNNYSFAWLQGYGDGTFRAAPDYYGQTSASGPGLGNGQYPQGASIASGDFNGDGIPDFVIGNTNNNTSAGITVFLSNPDGTLQPGVNYSSNTATANLQYVAVADFNGDGILDIAATDGVNGGVQIFTGNATGGVGNGTFTPAATEIATDSGTYVTLGIVAGVFGPSKVADIAVINNTTTPTADIGVLVNSGTGTFTLANYPLGSGQASLATTITAGNLGNNQIDLVAPLFGVYTGPSNNVPGDQVAIFLGAGNGTFAAASGSPVTLANASTGITYYNPYAAAIGNLGGTHPDLAITVQDETNFNQGMIIVLGNGDGTFQANPVLLPTTLQDPNVEVPIPASVAVADMNGDGIPDLAYTNSEFGTAGILYGQGGGAYYNPVEFPASRWAYNLVVAPFSGPGAQDVMVAGWENSLDFSGVTVLLNTGDTATTLTTSGTPSQAGAPVTFTATVAAKTRGTTGPPAGTVTFYNGATALGTGTLTSGTLQFTTTALPVGSNSITAAYNGDGGVTFLPSASAAVAQVVTQASSSTAINSSANPQQPGKPVTLTATVSATATGDVLKPTGTVNFFNNGVLLGTGTLNAAGQTAVTATLTTGSHSITAVYSGDTNFLGSTSPTFDQVIGQAASTTTVTSSANPAALNSTVTFTATVASAVAGSTVAPTGSVTFKDGSTTIGTGTVSSGKAAFATSSLTAGTHSITAVYGGDTNFTGSTSPALIQVISPASTGFTLSANPSSASVNPGSSATYKITVTPTGFSGSVSFSCPSSLPAGVSCSFSPNPLSVSGSAAVSTTLTIATTAPTSSMVMPTDINPARGNMNLLASLSAMGLVGLVLTGDWKKRKLSSRVIIMAVIALVMIMAWSGCGGGSSSGGGGTPTGGTPAGTYTVTVSGMGSNNGVSVANSVPVTLVVQ